MGKEIDIKALFAQENPELSAFLEERGALDAFLNNMESPDINNESFQPEMLRHIMICAAFVWSGTKEGRRYWSMLDTEFENLMFNN